LKSPSSLKNFVQSKATLHKAWRVIQENAQTSLSLDVRAEVDEFAADPQKNINILTGQLSSGSSISRKPRSAV